MDYICDTTGSIWIGLLMISFYFMGVDMCVRLVLNLFKAIIE